MSWKLILRQKFGFMVPVRVALPAKIPIGMSLCLPLMTNCLFARKASSLTIFVT